MWKRLSCPPETLHLDIRVDEEPEDIFVCIYNSGQENEVLLALKANLCETIGNMVEEEKGAALRFMQRAIRLCDTLGASNCKPFLEMLLLHNSKDYWGEDLEDLQELASRALSGMPKNASDFSFWRSIADKHNRSLPYALNAMIEIDIEKGLRNFIEAYNFCHKHKKLKEVNWNVLIEIAVDKHSKKKIGKTLDKIFSGKPEYYESFVHQFGLREISKIHKRSINDITSYNDEFEHNIESSENTLTSYEQNQDHTKNKIFKEDIMANYGTVFVPQSILSVSEEDYKWRWLPNAKTIKDYSYDKERKQSVLN